MFYTNSTDFAASTIDKEVTLLEADEIVRKYTFVYPFEELLWTTITLNNGLASNTYEINE